MSNSWPQEGSGGGQSGASYREDSMEKSWRQEQATFREASPDTSCSVQTPEQREDKIVACPQHERAEVSAAAVC